VQGSWSIRLCLSSFWAKFPSTPDSMSISLLGGNVDEDVDVGIGAVVHDMSKPTFGLVSMVVSKCCGGHST